MSEKVLLLAFKGEALCFVHVLLHALDLKERGHEAKIVLEGEATKLANELNDPAHPFASLYQNVRSQGLIDAVCQACAAKLGALAGVQAQGLPLRHEMKGHPSLAPYLDAGYKVITF